MYVAAVSPDRRRSDGSRRATASYLSGDGGLLGVDSPALRCVFRVELGGPLLHER